ncbi:MAG: homocysteine S-methyltransferase family protein [Clostridia bacterium]|nr:homocysteine S-methyltransferase family protein [Clostridia bacterium]
MSRKITLLDGAVGTSLWEKAEAHGWKKDPVWQFNITHPEIVTELNREYADAGAQIVLANTFGANGPAVKRYSGFTVENVVKSGVRLAKTAVAGTNAKVALSIGPLSMLMEPWGDLTEEETRVIYEEMIGYGMSEKPDCIMLQTFMDMEMMRVAASAAKQYSVPVYCTMTFEKRGKTMMGNSVQDVIDTLTPLGIDAIGMNCSLGPGLALPVIREFREKTDLPLIFKPNAGKPILAADGSTVSAYDEATFVREVAPALEFADYVGGCCGSNAAYTRALRKYLDEQGL